LPVEVARFWMLFGASSGLAKLRSTVTSPDIVGHRARRLKRRFRSAALAQPAEQRTRNA
jgi:hypothetical protein